MSMIRLFLLTLLCICLLAGKFLRPTIADQALIDQVCGKTPEPAACQQCIQQDSRHLTEDVRELAGTTIRCASDLGQTVRQGIDAIAGSTEDPAVKDLCLRCTENIGGVCADSDEALGAWASSHYQNAINFLGRALGEHQQCANIVNGIPASPQFFNDFNTLKKFMQDASAVLPQIQ